MSTPRFTASAVLDRSSEHYQGSAELADLRRDQKLRVRAAARPVAYCSMKGCCIDLRVLGFPRVCCNGDECGTDVLI
jgi:hypothetical protein